MGSEMCIRDRLITVNVGAYQAGAWADAPVTSIHLIAGDKHGIFMRYGYTAQGWTVGVTSVLTRIGDSFTEVLRLISDQSDPDGRGWTSKMTTKPTNGAFYAIDVERRGYDDQSEGLVFLDGDESLKYDVADYNDVIRQQDTFTFDGLRYSRDVAIS